MPKQERAVPTPDEMASAARGESSVGNCRYSYAEGVVAERARAEKDKPVVLPHLVQPYGHYYNASEVQQALTEAGISWEEAE